MMYSPATYTYPMTIHLDGLGMFTYTPMSQADTQVWLDHHTRGLYHQKATILNQLPWFELNPFERILETTETLLTQEDGVRSRCGDDAVAKLAHLHGLLELRGPEATLRFFLHLCSDLSSSLSFFDLESAMWEDCHFVPGGF